MLLPDDDEKFLNERGYDWTLYPDGDKAGFLVIRNFDVTGGGFTPSVTDLMIRIPAQYNMAQLDMWYCCPSIKLASGQPVLNTEVTEHFLGRQWQRFSRHLLGGVWRAGVDNLRSFMPLIWLELQGKGGAR